MNDLLIYLFKSAGLLSLFYLNYKFFLQKDTSFIQNRIFLLGGIFTAAILPAITFTTYIPVNVPVYFHQFQLEGATANTTLHVENTFDWWQLVGALYLAIFVILLFRFLFQIFSISNIITKGTKIKLENYKGVQTSLKTGPFSFLNVIVFNPNLHTKEELKLIFEHEKVHARQKHSIDILLANLLAIMLWFNPLSWMYKKAMEQNLEFLADSEAANTTISKTAYQKAMLRTILSTQTPTLSNNFYQSSIKKRIIMLNKNQNPKNNSWKIALILPALFAFVLIFSCSNETNDIGQAEISSEKELTTSLIVVDDEIKDGNFDVNSISPEKIEKVAVVKGMAAAKKYGDKGKNGVIEIYLKSEQELQQIQERKNDLSFTAEKLQFDNSQKSTSLKLTGVHTINMESSEVLYVLNEKVQDENFNPGEVDVENIEAINVLKGEIAVEKYGDKGKNGVIEVTFKKD